MGKFPYKDIEWLSDSISNDEEISDYELWSIQMKLERFIFSEEKMTQPIPIDYIQIRRIIALCREKRRRNRDGS